MTTISYDYEVVVIGSGFGGGILACRTSKAWPGRVLVLERGKRYPMGSFPRTPHDMARNFWNLPDEARARAKHFSQDESHGMFDIRNFRGMNAVVCAGYGGGSLIYANVFMRPPEAVFAEGWPKSITRSGLEPYYQIAKAVLGARPMPQNGDPRRRVVRAELFREVARKEGRDSQLCDINVFFGNDFDKLTPIGVQEKNRYGALQTSCVYCGECDVGCNTHSKNTVDLNYLFVAEHRYGARILTEHLAERIVPLNAAGQDDAGADGGNGYRVHYRDLNGKRETSASARRVVVSAGTLGSNELLLRCREVFKTLPGLNDNLGKRFSGNGDFLSFVIEGKQPADPNYGPVITQRTDFNLFSDFDRPRAFLLEDASYPAFAAWMVEGLRPSVSHFAAIGKAIKDGLRRLFSGSSMDRIGFAMGDVLGKDMSYSSSVLLCMGLDNAGGVAGLDAAGYLEIEWPRKENMPLYEAILDAGERFRHQVGAKACVPMPNWWWPFRQNITVHPLGGCRLADSPAGGLTSAQPREMGQVFGYKGLYVADGSIVPTALGANPIATISALSERVAEGITGRAPDADL